MATENIMMDCVKRGGDRQELHERIRVHSMEASRRVKQGDGINDLMDRIAGDPAFGVTAGGAGRYSGTLPLCGPRPGADGGIPGRGGSARAGPLR